MKLDDTIFVSNTATKRQPLHREEPTRIEEAARHSKELPEVVYGVSAGSQEHEDMVKELAYLKKYDPALYDKIMSLS